MLFPDHFIQSVSILCLDDWATAHHSKENGTHHNRLPKYQDHSFAYIEGSEPPEEVEPSQAFLIHILCVGGPLQFVVQVDSGYLYSTSCQFSTHLNMAMSSENFHR